MLLALGVLAGVLAARGTGRGTVVDAAMIDGVSALMAMFHSLRGENRMPAERGTGLLDSGAFFYDVYRTRDGKWVSIAAIETQFWADLCTALDLPDELREHQFDTARWEDFRKILAARVAEFDRDDLDELFSNRNTCYAPVLTLDEATDHPHNLARNTFVGVDGIVQGAPAPRFDGVPSTAPRAPRLPGADTRQLLAEANFTAAEIDNLLAANTVAEAQERSDSVRNWTAN